MLARLLSAVSERVIRPRDTRSFNIGADAVRIVARRDSRGWWDAKVRILLAEPDERGRRVYLLDMDGASFLSSSAALRAAADRGRAFLRANHNQAFLQANHDEADDGSATRSAVVAFAPPSRRYVARVGGAPASASTWSD